MTLLPNLPKNLLIHLSFYSAWDIKLWFSLKLWKGNIYIIWTRHRKWTGIQIPIHCCCKYGFTSSLPEHGICFQTLRNLGVAHKWRLLRRWGVKNCQRAVYKIRLNIFIGLQKLRLRPKDQSRSRLFIYLTFLRRFSYFYPIHTNVSSVVEF